MAMRQGQRTVAIPNPHGADELDWTLVKRILVQAGISAERWEEIGRI